MESRPLLGVPRHRSRTTYANLDCVFVENALIFGVSKIDRAQAPLPPPPSPLSAVADGPEICAHRLLSVTPAITD